MDNKTPENPRPLPKIPEHWRIPRSAGSPTEILQLDINSGFLAAEFDDGEAEFFFGVDSGELVDYKYLFSRPGVRGRRFLTSWIRLGRDIDIYPSSYETLKGQNSYLQLSFLKPIADKKENLLMTGLATADFNEGNLERITIGGLFSTDDKGERIESPVMSISLKEVHDAEATSSWHINIYSQESLGYASHHKPNGLDLKDRDGQLVYDVKWEVVNGELVVVQTHLQKGIVKQVRSPLALDMEKVNKALAAKPPYEKERKHGIEVLNVPWRNIPQIVGASILYSHLPKLQANE